MKEGSKDCSRETGGSGECGSGKRISARCKKEAKIAVERLEGAVNVGQG